MLRQHPALEHLDVAHNTLGPLTAAAIAKALAQNTSITELDVSGNALGHDGGAVMRAALETSNTTLERCQLAASGCTQTDIVAIAEMMQSRQHSRAKKHYSRPHRP